MFGEKKLKEIEERVTRLVAQIEESQKKQEDYCRSMMNRIRLLEALVDEMSANEKSKCNKSCGGNCKCS